MHFNNHLTYFEMTLSRATIFSALALGATCMVINQTPQTSKIEARSSWDFLGCYTDNVSGRALPNGEAVPGGTNAMTNELCQATCLAGGFKIAGTEYAGECCKSLSTPRVLLFKELTEMKGVETVS
jgi:WSC domain